MVDLIRDENYGGREDVKSIISDKSVRAVAKEEGWFAGMGHEHRIWHKGKRGFLLSTSARYVQMAPEALREEGLQIWDVKSVYRKFVGPKPM